MVWLEIVLGAIGLGFLLSWMRRRTNVEHGSVSDSWLAANRAEHRQD